MLAAAGLPVNGTLAGSACAVASGGRVAL